MKFYNIVLALCFLLVNNVDYAFGSSSSSGGSSSSGSSSSSSSGSRSRSRSSSSDEDCGCEDTLTTIQDRFEIEQLIYGLQYAFDDITNGRGSVAEFVSFMEENAIKNLTAIVVDNVFEGLDAFTGAIGFIGSLYQNHFIAGGGVQYLELTDNIARTRVNQINFSIQFGFQDYTADITFYDFIKINGQWKFTLINNPIAVNLCVVGSAYDDENGCENPSSG